MAGPIRFVCRGNRGEQLDVSPLMVEVTDEDDQLCAVLVRSDKGGLKILKKGTEGADVYTRMFKKEFVEVVDLKL
jgi:hypothetical protein